LSPLLFWTLIPITPKSVFDIRKFLPDFPLYDKPITIRHLIHHTSGIRDYLAMWQLSGKYFSEELQATYNLFVEDCQLFLQVGSHPKRLLKTTGDGIFFSKGGKLNFETEQGRMGTSNNRDQKCGSRLIAILLYLRGGFKWKKWR
jgi:hypothetical protein